MATSAARAAPRLTAGGARQLRDGGLARGGVVVQLLGVFRYLVDPALRRRLAPFEFERDAFDMLLSDGARKIKCVLAPETHKLVWTGDIAPFDIVLVESVEVLRGDSDQYSVCVVKELQAITNLRNRPEGSIRSSEVQKLEFTEAQHPRQVDLLPLVGDREYYLPLRSDTFSLDWQSSFCAGVQEDASPLTELERWNGSDHDVTCQQWIRRSEYCTSILANGRVFSIEDALATTSRLGNSSLPMTGTIRVKSQVTHMGDPEVSSAFPFVFHIVLVDCSSAVEVAFYGDMCARYFLSLQEGDLVQLEGYKVAQPGDIISDFAGSSPVLYFEHQSAGHVWHVPEKYWRLLVAAKSLPWPADEEALKALSKSTSDNFSLPNGALPRKLPTRWLECSYFTTQNTQHFSDQERMANDQFYFEVVGVLSYVGKICRKRKRKGEDSVLTGITEYRWVKLIDGSSSLELTIKMTECSQPAVFRSLEAGNSIMITKLQWAIDSFGDKHAIEYARTSNFSIFRVNEDIMPFRTKSECKINSLFASALEPEVVKMKQQGESALSPNIASLYRPPNTLPTTAAEFIEAFGISSMNFSDLRDLSDEIEMREHRHVGLIGSIVSVSGAPGARYSVKGYLSLQDRVDKDSELTVRIETNQLFQSPHLTDETKKLIPIESLPLIRVMSPDLQESLYSSVASAAASALRIAAQPLTLAIIQAWMVRREAGFFFSLHVFRDANGSVVWSIDAILPAP